MKKLGSNIDSMNVNWCKYMPDFFLHFVAESPRGFVKASSSQQSKNKRAVLFRRPLFNR